MDPNVRAKLDQLKEYWYNEDYSLKWVEEVENSLRRLIATEELSKNKAVIPIIEDAKNRISAVNKLLIYDVDMPTDVRQKLIRERDVHQFWLDRFDGRDIDKRFDLVNKILDEEIVKITS